MLWIWVAIVVVVYFILVFVIAPFVIPFLGNMKAPVRLPKMVEDLIKHLESKSKTPHDYIKECYEYVLSKNECARLATLTRVNLAFETDVKKIFDRRGFMHCTHLNYQMYILLTKSKFFTEDQVKPKRTFVNLNVHQYLKVKVAGQWYDVDPGADHFGIPLGKHVWGIR